MNDIEKRARELLARLQKAKRNEAGHWCDARAAVDASCDTLPQIIAALTPPEGYVLVPVEATRPMKDAVESFAIPHCYLRTGVQIADFNERYRAMLAARPEVKP